MAEDEEVRTLVMSGMTDEIPPDYYVAVPVETKPEWGTWDSWVKGSKMAQLPEFLRKMALQYGVTITHMDVMSRWLSETVFFKVEGDWFKMLEFRVAVMEALEDHNK